MEEPSTVSATQARPAWLWCAALAVAGLAAYSNAFQGEFILDDHGGIVGNPHITSLWPLSRALTSPRRTTAAGRPVLAFSEALNYAICGMDFRGWRAFNLAIHLAASLALFGVLRRAFLSQRLRAQFDAASTPLAFFAALLWELHPLQTQPVNYITQRCESIMALCYLLTFYCAIRSFAAGARVRYFWHLAAVSACALGMGSKEVMVSAPLMVLLYDWIFDSGTLRAALRRSPALYSGLAATWAILGFLVVSGGTADGANLGRKWGHFEYALTQASVIPYYLRLAFWPAPLCFDYNWPAAQSISEILPGLALMFSLIAATLWALWKKPELGFLGVCFFAALAPSSSIVPLPDMACEYRMYLALAPLCSLIVVCGYGLLNGFSAPASTQAKPRWPLIAGIAFCAIIAVLFGVQTWLRNADYHSAIAIWRDTMIKRPMNARGHVNLAVALASKGRLDDAMVELLTAEHLDPKADTLHLNLGCILAMKGLQREALPHFELAVQQDPRSAKSHYNLGNFLSDLGRKSEAAEAYKDALKLDPDFRDAHFNFAVDLARLGATEDALFHFNEAVRIDPQFAAAQYELGVLLAKAGRRDEAATHLAAALALDPQNQNARKTLKQLTNE